MGGVENVEQAIASGGWYFHTPGDGRVLLPWGASERVSRKIDATDPEDLTFAEVECRRQVMAEVDRLRAEVPGFRRAHVCDVASQLGITESRRLLGDYVLECGPEALRAQKALLRQWEELPLTESVNLSVGVFGQSFLTGEPQRLMQGFLARKR